MADASRQCEWQRLELVCGFPVPLRKQAGRKSTRDHAYFIEKFKSGNRDRSQVFFRTYGPDRQMVRIGAQWLYSRLAQDGRQRDLLPELFRSEEHTSELQSLRHLVCRLLLEKNNKDLAASLNIGQAGLGRTGPRLHSST